MRKQDSSEKPTGVQLKPNSATQPIPVYNRLAVAQHLQQVQTSHFLTLNFDRRGCLHIYWTIAVSVVHEEAWHSNYLLAGARASSANLSSGKRSPSLQNYFKAPEIQESASR